MDTDLNGGQDSVVCEDWWVTRGRGELGEERVSGDCEEFSGCRCSSLPSLSSSPADRDEIIMID